jgi:hypothetical protein
MRSYFTLALLLAAGCGCEDLDLDGVCDSRDLCLGDDAAGDSDDDGVCDDRDVCAGDDATGDSDGDGVCDDRDVCAGDDATGDSDGDGVCDDLDACDGDDATGDLDGDGLCDDIDGDIDGDTVLNGVDRDPRDRFVCSDVDGDSCDDCVSGTFDPAADGPDLDGDGLCDAGDPDIDGDGVPNETDTDPRDPFVCGDVDEDTCEDCASGTFDPANDGPDWNGDGICDAVDPPPEGFKVSQSVLGRTVTCSRVTETTEYTQCDEAQVEGLYFPNGVECGPLWSTRSSPYTDHAAFCQQITGSSRFEVYYACTSTVARVTLYGITWGTIPDNGYTQHIRCFFGD